MADSIPLSTLEKFTTFGDLLRYLRRRAGITQLELSIAVGYSDAHISRLEQNQRLPDIPTLQARFISPLCLEDEPRAVSRLVELASEVRREDAPTPGLCPYKGMDYFDEADADLFVGREALTEKLTEDVLALASKSQHNDRGFMAILGASGCGKSSLVRAGLMPALRWNKASANWTMHVLTPSAHPLQSLATTLDRGASLAAIAGLMDDLAGDPRALSLYINREIKTPLGSYYLLVIDQFEELFALCHDEEERTVFIDNLLTSAFDPDVKAIIIITLRADFYGHCAKYPQLRQALAKHQEYIGAMNDEEMRRAIEEPARRGHWEFEPGLVDLILHDVGHEPGALPLLSHALLETWERRRGRTLTFSGYASSGGVRGAIAETAESVFTDQFTREQQAIARRIFLRLTELGDETTTGDTRRKVTYDELILKPEEKASTQAVLKALADARLVTTSEEAVQVAHEALIREWPTLRSWLEENREGLRLHRQLTEETQDWLTAGREPDLLFRGARLSQAREWSDSHQDDMNVLEKEFLDASIAYSEREAAEREAARQRELETAQKLADTERKRAEEGQKSSQRLRRRAILVTILGMMAGLLAVFALFAWQRSASQAALNHSLNLANAAQSLNVAGQGDLALILALEAVQIKDPPPEVLTALRSVAYSFGTRAVLSGHKYAVQTVAISPDEKTALSGSCAEVDPQGSCREGELILWDLKALREQHRWSAGSTWVTAIAYSLDGKTLISGFGDGSLSLWDVNGEQVGSLMGHTGGISDLVLMRGTGNLLSGSLDGSMMLWDLDTKERVRSYAPTSSPITSIAAAVENSTAVSAHKDGSMVIWDLANPQYIQRFPNKGEGIVSVAITPDGSRILYSTKVPPDHNIRLIDSRSGEILNTKSFGCIPGDLALSSDLSFFLMTCSTAIQQLDFQSWNMLSYFLDSPVIANVLSVSQDGHLGLSGMQDGTLRVWNVNVQQDYRSLDIHPDALTAIAVSTEGRYLLLNDAEQDNIQQPALWDLAAGMVVRTYPDFGGGISPGAVAISPDSRFVAAAGINNDTNETVVKVWDMQSGEPRCAVNGLTEYGRAVAFSPDSLYLLAGTQELNGRVGQLVLWDVQQCRLKLRFDTNEEISSIQFSRDGSRALTGSSLLGRVTLWDVSTGKEIGHFSHSGINLDAVFGPGDITVLSTGEGDIFKWDVETKDLLGRFTGIHNAPWSLAISPDGNYLLAGAADGDAILWDFSTREQLGRINLGNVVLDVDFSPDGKTAYAASMDGKLIEWPIAEKPLSELLDWINANRYVRELTCDEKAQYRVDPQCNP